MCRNQVKESWRGAYAALRQGSPRARETLYIHIYMLADSRARGYLYGVALRRTTSYIGKGKMQGQMSRAKGENKRNEDEK